MGPRAPLAPYAAGAECVALAEATLAVLVLGRVAPAEGDEVRAAGGGWEGGVAGALGWLG